MDGLYRLLLTLLPRDFDARDREEMWDTYLARVAHARGDGGWGSAQRQRLSELLDLSATLAGGLWPFPTLDSFRQDLRVAVRSTRRAPLASGLAVASLALGIGATSALFSALDVWLIQPLPLPNADELVGVRMANRERGWNGNAFSIRDYSDWSRASRSVSLMVYARSGHDLNLDDLTERVSGLQVSANALDVLGIEPALGRGFAEDEGRPGGPDVVLLSHSFWRRLGEDPAIVGRSVVLDGRPRSVIGVLPSRQGIPGHRVDVWVPLRISGQESRSGHFLWGIGLMAEGVDLDAARSELDAVAVAVAQLDPERTFPHATVRPLREMFYGIEYRQGGLVVGGAALFVLLIACANIANLLLARGLSRSHEMAVRGTLGAGRGRMIQQLLVESSLIALVGGVVGIGVAVVGIELLLTYALPPDEVLGWDQISLNGRVLTGAVVLTVVSALVFGLVPALRTSAVDLRGRLAESGRDGTQSRRKGLGSLLVVSEISATLVLVALSGLMIRALVEIRSTDMEMRSTDALLFRLDVPPRTRSDAEAVDAFYSQLAERLTSVSGVSGMTTTSGHILSQWSTYLYAVSSVGATDGDSRLSAEHRRVTPSYLDVMGLRLLAGRWFDPAVDVATGTPVAVVSRALTMQWWEDPADAVGKTILYGDDERLIVGVIDPGRIRGPGEAPPPMILQPFAQGPVRFTFNVLAHTLEHPQAVTIVQDVVREMDPDMAVFGMVRIEDAFEQTLGPQTAGFRILGALGSLALVLTLVGVYGVMAHAVGRRRREMGLRMALGADGDGLIRMVLVGNARLALLGVAIGLVVAMAAGQGLAFMLEDVSPRDPAALTAGTVLVLLAVLAASYLPARRAALVDPVRTLQDG